MVNDILAKYAPRIDRKSYEQQVSLLYKDAADGAFSNEEKPIGVIIKAKEFELTIDYRLGKNFPTEKRVALWQAMQRVEGQKLRLVARYLATSLKKRAFANGMQIMLERMIEEFSKILTQDELNAFLAMEEGERPVLPIDPGLL